MQLHVKKSFDWAHRGIEVEKFSEGDVIETEDADLIKVATDEGWCSTKANAEAPENKAQKAPQKK